MKHAVAFSLTTLLICCNTVRRKEDRHIIAVGRAVAAPTLDGKITKNCWHLSPWYPLDQNWVGKAFSPDDFQGRYKISWDKEALYVLMEITDDTLYDRHKDPLKRWWDDDSLEVFVDEDNSGGLHQFSYNAFGYNVALNGHVADLGPDREPRLHNEHVRSVRRYKGKICVWELAIRVYPGSYSAAQPIYPVTLKAGKKIGFALAYGDNDGSLERENLIGSVFIPGTDKNQAWIDANILGTLILKE